MDRNEEDFFRISNVPERCNVGEFGNGENRPIDSDGDQSYSSQEFARDRSTNRRLSAVNDVNYNRRNRTDSNSSRKTDNGWRSGDIKYDDEIPSWRRNTDENHPFRAKSSVSRSSTRSFGETLYSRSSSRHRTSFDENEQINWRDRSVKIDEKPAVFNFGKRSSRTDRSHEVSYKNEHRLSQQSKSEDLDDFGRFERPKRPHDRNQTKPGNKNREKFIGENYLNILSEKEPHDMICEILRPDANIDVVLKRKEIQADWIFLIMKTIRKIIESDFKSNRAQVLQHFCQSTSLLDHISSYLGEVGLEKNPKTVEKLNSFVSDLVIFYSAVIMTIPTVAMDKNLEKFIVKTKMGIDQIKIYLDKEIDKTVVEKLENLEKILQDETNVREKKMGKSHRKYLEIVGDLPPPEDFRELSLYPTEEDLNRTHFGFVRPNKIKGRYEGVEHYLDVQFRLIREDFIDPLRRGLNTYKNSTSFQRPRYKYESVRFYPNTRIEKIEITKENKVAYVVNFNVDGRLRVKWDYSKRFMFGSLLLFSRDDFQTFFFATVFNRDLEWLRGGCILVTLVGNELLGPEMLNQAFVMAESEVYFEPYCLIMKALKEFDESDFPMKKFIVDGDTTADLPKYIINKKNFDVYGYSVNLEENVNWPDASVIGFDPHQFDAFKTALTSNFTVIQGPPGTGKTYLGLKIVEVLLENVRISRDYFRTPILLVCYTNHALDQFLEGILKYTDKIVRVGGQSKSDVLKQYNLRGKENLYSLHTATQLFPAMENCRDEMRRILYDLKKKTKEKKMLENPEGILCYRILSEVISPEFKQFIHNDESLQMWLLNTNSRHSIAQNSRNEKVAKKVRAYPADSSIEIDEEIYAEEEDTMEADVLINEDNIFDFEEIDPEDLYGLSVYKLKNLHRETQSRLSYLEQNESKFDDYAEYFNETYQLNERLRIIEFQVNILYHYLGKPKLNSFTEYHTRYLNLWNLPLDHRWSTYWSWVSQLKQIYEIELQNLEVEHRSKNLQYEEFKQLEDFHIVKDSLVVGMTTTGAARLQLFLKTLSPAIVIVEEAAEVLEAHILVSLSKNCQHVILIGDHKQLKPNAAVYELSKKYNINVSLFERMINNDMYCPQLQIQHRMRPEISSLIVPSVYPNLENHESVREYPSVKGITKNLFFVEHTVYEEDVDDSSSRKNKFEADFMIQLCRYILLQGYSEQQITILTTYTGQMFLLREMKRDYSLMRDVKIIVVDKYQGEENDIVLLSLVRSNEERKIGFLSIENRICVALSRAKIGLYIIGNMDMLADCKLWRNIKEELLEQEAIGPKLTLYCNLHDVYTEVSCKSDFNNVLEGGCNKYCDDLMDCGHRCPRLCHKIDLEHWEQTCHEKCLKRCVENHPCVKLCYQDCGDCNEYIERTLPCGHKVTLHCFEDYSTYPCQEEFDVILEHCSHEAKKKCHQSMNSINCIFPCEDRLECGHQCVKNCHKTDDPDHLEYKCHKPCEKINRECSKQHACEKLCFQECGKCRVRIDFTLDCGHNINLQCSADLDRIKCYKQCERRCSECNVICSKKCYEDCKPCMNKVMKSIPECGHKRVLECSVAPERKLCLEKCERNAPCGHKCKSICGKECGTEQCLEVVKSTCVEALCGHGYANVPCWQQDRKIEAELLLQFCTEPCNEKLKCGDICSGTCGSCWQGRLHQTCKQKCGNVLVCGHGCEFPCRNVCPPCNKKCQYACKHSKCPRKCGIPCVPCKEKCEWRCFHFKCNKKCDEMCNRPPCYEPCRKKLKCKHDCIGFCGEPCPPKCRICDEDEVKTILFGHEDEDDARFVLLVDCGHFIESKAMDKYINMAAEKQEIVMKVCPICKTPISKTLRYMNQVKKVYRDIQNVKRKIYGNEKEIKQIRQDLMEGLKNLKKTTFKENFRFQRITVSSIFDALRLINEIILGYEQKLVNNRKQSQPFISKQALRAMHFFIDMFSSIGSRWDDFKKCPRTERSRLSDRLKLILKHVKPEALQINEQLVEETQRELNRYHRIVDYVIYSNKPEYLRNRGLPNVVSVSAEIVDILYGLKCFDNERDTRIGELFEKLHEEIKASEPVTKEEKRMIHEAMAKDFYGGVNKQGHWFTCTKGHYYCITECGGAMQESECPECGEKIGGSNHRYVETARLASDMDGATRPAWSSGVDIRNFNLD